MATRLLNIRMFSGIRHQRLAFIRIAMSYIIKSQCITKTIICNSKYTITHAWKHFSILRIKIFPIQIGVGILLFNFQIYYWLTIDLRLSRLTATPFSIPKVCSDPLQDLSFLLCLLYTNDFSLISRTGHELSIIYFK